MAHCRPHLTPVPNVDMQPGTGKVDEFTAVYAANRGRLVKFLTLLVKSSEDAEDLAQSAYVKLRSNRDGLTGKNLCGLLFVTARNLAFDHHRRLRRQWNVQQSLDDHADLVSRIPNTEPAADRLLIASENLQIVRTLLDELPPKCQSAFVAYKFEERDYAEIAAEMQVSESMVRKYVLKAMNHCTIRFKEMEGWL